MVPEYRVTASSERAEDQRTNGMESGQACATSPGVLGRGPDVPDISRRSEHFRGEFCPPDGLLREDYAHKEPGVTCNSGTRPMMFPKSAGGRCIFEENSGFRTSCSAKTMRKGKRDSDRVSGLDSQTPSYS